MKRKEKIKGQEKFKDKNHAGTMTEKEAVAVGLMLKMGFKEEGEVEGKWSRACLALPQLSTCYAGNLEALKPWASSALIVKNNFIFKGEIK